jgi:hypothetical protein
MTGQRATWQEAVMKGFIYLSSGADFPMIAVVFEPDGTIVCGKAVESVFEGEEFIRDKLVELRRVMTSLK